MPMINEAIYAVMEGVGTPEAIDTVMKLGMNHPMGPLALADFIGLDICLAILNVLHDGLGDPEVPAVSTAPPDGGGRPPGPEVRARFLRIRVSHHAPTAIGPTSTISWSAARRLIAIARAVKGSRRSVPGKTSSPEKYQVSLRGQSACSPYGALASAPSQSSRTCDVQARPHASPIRYPSDPAPTQVVARSDLGPSPLKACSDPTPRLLRHHSDTALTCPVTAIATIVRRMPTGMLWVAVRCSGL